MGAELYVLLIGLAVSVVILCVLLVSVFVVFRKSRARQKEVQSL